MSQDPGCRRLRERQIDDGPQRIVPIFAQPPVSGLTGLVACGGPSQDSILAARAQHSALLGLEPLFTTNNFWATACRNLSLIVK